MATKEQPARSVEQLVAAHEIVVACGSGGVGKTTTAAALAVMATVRHGGKVLVLTVDPAKRLANALGLEGFGNVARQVPPEAFKQAGVKPRGELWAAMLDTKQSWDDLVNRHAPDPVTARRILDNPLYQNITGRFVQSHEYIAVERLYEMHSDGAYDLIVVDTPPTRNALDFLDAPERMGDFFSSRLLRLLTVPYKSRIVNFASKPFYQVADRILGSQFLEDIAEFFILFQTMGPGFVERARGVTRLLHDRRTTFVVVTTLEAAPAHEAEFFIDTLHDRKFHLGAVVFNKVLPAYMRDSSGAAGRLSEQLEGRAAEVAEELGPVLDVDTAQLHRVVTEVAENFLRFEVVAQREAEQEQTLGRIPDVVASVPYFDSDIFDLSGLVQLGEKIRADGVNGWEGGRVRLRALEPTDADAFAAEIDTDAARLGWRVFPPRSAWAVTEWVRQASEQSNDGDDFRLAIEAVASGDVVGSLNTYGCNAGDGVCSYGIGIFPWAQRQGYARESVVLVLRYLFGERRYQKCTVGVYGFNAASVAFHEALGFQHEGRIRRAHFALGAHHDEIMLGITVEEFEKLWGFGGPVG